MRRRELLRALLLVLSGPSKGVAGQPGPRSAGQVERGVDGGPLSPAERQALLGFAEVLVEGRPLSPAERREMLGYIEDRASGEMLALYRDAAALLDRLAGAPFSSVGIRQRTEIVARHGLAPSPRVPPPDEGAHAVRTRVAPDLIAGYWGSAAGWAAVGYAVFPGRCGDLERYTRPEP